MKSISLKAVRTASMSERIKNAAKRVNQFVISHSVAIGVISAAVCFVSVIFDWSVLMSIAAVTAIFSVGYFEEGGER